MLPRWLSRSGHRERGGDHRHPTACGRLLRASLQGRASGGARLAGYLRAAAGVPADGKRLAESGYAVLVVNPFYRVKHAPTAPVNPDFNDLPTRDALMGLMNALTPQTAATDATAFFAWLDASRPWTGSAERHDRLLHGRTAHHAHRGRRAGPHRRRGLVPRRGTRDRQARQSSPADPEDEGPVPHRHRRQR